MRIFALDLGKFKTMCCFFDSLPRKDDFLTVATERNYLAVVLTKHQIDLVVMETCGPSARINDPCTDN
jgi:transposase